jgi:hypothetical protein
MLNLVQHFSNIEWNGMQYLYYYGDTQFCGHPQTVPTWRKSKCVSKIFFFRLTFGNSPDGARAFHLQDMLLKFTLLFKTIDL